MIEIKEKAECCGCTACEKVCPKKCISMLPDSEGFLYPDVDYTKCINCNLCVKVCPILNKPGTLPIQKGYIVRNRDMKILKTSSSGGFFSALCELVIDREGVVFGASFDEELAVRHVKAESLNDCIGFRGSKYVQSDVGDTYIKVKEALKQGKWVCYSGTPCEISGLRNYLGRDYDHLILVDFVCHGVPSPKLWKEYLKYMSKKYDSEIIEANFRSKKNGYQSLTMNLKFANGKDYYGSVRTDIMLKSFFRNICLRESCYKCEFKSKKRCSDLTIYDCWHAGKILDIDDDDLGYTSILVRSDKGLSLIDELNHKLEIYEKPIDEVIPIGGGMLVKNTQRHKDRDDYYSMMNDVGLKEAFDRYLGVSKMDYMMEALKKVLRKMGVLPRLSRMKKIVKKKRS